MLDLQHPVQNPLISVQRVHPRCSHTLLGGKIFYIFSSIVSSIMQSKRKVQGAQWYVTLPKEWRNENGHNILKGDVMLATFEPDSVLVLNPSNRVQPELEEKLVQLLIGLPKLKSTRELIESLRGIIEDLDKA